LDESRRKFFSFGKKLSFLMLALYFENVKLNKSECEDKFVIVNGWVLKKDDLI